MIHLLRSLILLSFLGFAACKKGVPEIENLRKMGGFSLDQNLIAVSSKTSPSFTLTGKCLDSYSDIEVSFDGGEDWSSVKNTASSATLACGSSGTFSLSFAPAVSTFISAGSVAAGGTWKFRAISEFGNSEALALDLFVPQKGHLVLAGANLTTSGSLRLSSHVSANLPSSITGGYILKGTVKAR